MAIGSIISGTLRPQDTIPAFLDALRDIAPDHYAQLAALPFGPIPAHAAEDDLAEWWASEEAGYLQEELTHTLSEHAPPFTYFGSHEGDGADFSFWIDWNAITEAEQEENLLRVEDLAELGDFDGYVLVVNDHGNATLYDSTRATLWAVA